MAGSLSNAPGIGARVELTTSSGTQYQQMTGGSHQFGQAVAPLHFGLGSATSAGLVIRWPSGEVQQFQDILGDRRFVANEGVEPLQFLRAEPRQVSRGKTVMLRISGAGFSAATAAAFSSSSGVNVVGQRARATQLQVTIQIDASATTGRRDLILTNPDGQRATGIGAIELR